MNAHVVCTKLTRHGYEYTNRRIKDQQSGCLKQIVLLIYLEVLHQMVMIIQMVCICIA